MIESFVSRDWKLMIKKDLKNQFEHPCKYFYASRTLMKNQRGQAICNRFTSIFKDKNF